MTLDRNTLASLGLTVLLITSVVPAGIVGFSGTASADHHGAWYTLSQPGTDVCYEVQAFTNDHEKMRPEVEVRGTNTVGDVTGPYRDPDWNGFESIESIMDYRYRYYPNGSEHAVGQTEYYAPYLNDQYRAEGWEYGTYGLYNWSENGDSHLFFYENANGEVSLVVRHDKIYEEVGTSSHRPYNGEYTNASENPDDGFFEPSPGGGSVTWTFDSLPAGEWAYLDDLYPNEGMDDTYTDADGVRYGHREANYDAVPIREFRGGWFRAEWGWSSWGTKHGTDGGAYRGFQNLADGESVTITNSFSGDLDEWEVRHNDGTTNGEQLDLVMGEPLVVTRGQHCLDGGSLGATPDPVEAGQTVTFSAPEDAEEYRWDYAGNESIDETTADNTVTRAYNATGEAREVAVSVTMVRDGQTAQANTTITVRPAQAPTADFAVGDDAGDPDYHVVGESLTLNGSLSSDNVALSTFQWDVNGTAKSGETVSHAFESVGDHEVTLTVTDRAGETSNRTKTITVVAEDDPTARASASATEVEAGAPVTFDGSASSDEHGRVASYEWDLAGGDGPDETGAQVRWRYDAAGTKNVTLTVTDSNGNTDTANRTVTVVNGSDPAIDSVTVPDELSVSETLAVKASASDESALTYTWTFNGTGTQVEKTGRRVSHSFDQEGTATVRLVVTDAANRTNATGEMQVEVTGKPSAALSGPSKTRVGTSVTFDASSSTDESSISRFEWDFDGDGAPEQNTTGENPTATWSYGSTGTYDATVTVVDDDGQTDTASDTVDVKRKKQAHTDSGGGGGGDDGGSAVSFGPPPVMIETEQVGPSEVAIDVRNGRADETIRASLPASEATSETAVRFKSVAIDVGGEDAHVVFRTTASAQAPERVPTATPTDETFAYLDLSAEYLDASVENATVEFTVRRSALGEYGVPDDVTVHRYDGSWTRLNATVVETNGDAVRLKATADGLGTLAVGANENVAVTDAGLANGSVTTGETVEATATVENRGPTARTATLNLTLSGGVVAAETVEVPAGETRQVTLTATAPTPGTYDVTVGGASAGTLAVQEVQPADVSITDVSLDDSTIAAGEQATVTVTVANAGGKAGEQTVTFSMFGEELATRTVRVPAGETEQVTFDQRVDAAGTYTVAVNGETTSLQVTGEEESTTDETTDDGPGTGVPGFGVGTALVALLSAALLARLRR